MEYIKKASLSFEDASNKKRILLEEILQKFKDGGEDAVKEFAKKFDNWEGDFILSDEKKQLLIDQVPQRIKDDLQFAYEQVSGFAKNQRESIADFEKETIEGVRLGQKVIPMKVAGCYVPGGRFAHACSAIMSVAPAVVYAMHIAGADIILEMGGVQAIASMAYGLFTALQQGVVDGQENPYIVNYTMKFHEDQDYITEIHYQYSLQPLIVGVKSMKKYDEATRALLIRAGIEAQQHCIAFQILEAGKAKQGMIDGGIEVSVLEDEAEWKKLAIEKVWPEYSVVFLLSCSQPILLVVYSFSTEYQI
jgi:Histidinol dehydrogenase/Bacterial extracellular solute-binding protein, family 7